jgi:hypothetical protein
MQYELCLELAMGLDTVKRYHLRNSPVVKSLANLMHEYEIYDLELLNEVAESLLSVNNQRSEDALPDMTPQELFDAEILKDEIYPWVRDIRKAVFGKEDVPFPTRESAIEWLTKYALNDKGLFEEYRKVQRQSEGGEATFRMAFMEGMPFILGTPPVTLYDRTEEISQMMGINHPSLVMHVLANTRLVCPKWDLVMRTTQGLLPSDREAGTNSVTIRFRNSLSFEDMRQIYDRIRTKFKYPKSKQLNAKHLELYRLVSNRGIPQERGRVAFWKQIMEEWNRGHPEATYSSWRSVSIAYSRIIKKASRANRKGNGLEGKALGFLHLLQKLG